MNRGRPDADEKVAEAGAVSKTNGEAPEPVGALPETDPDAELVRAAQAGDAQAFEALVRRYQHRVYNLAYRSLHDREAAEEVAQEVFVSIYRYIKRFRGGSRFTSWMYRIVINHCRTRMRHRRRHPDETSNVRVEAPVETAEGNRTIQFPDESAEANPERKTSAKEQVELIQQALDDLDDEHRMVLILRDIEDLNYSEIAEFLGLPEGTVKSRIHRARNHLKERLSKYLEGTQGAG